MKTLCLILLLVLTLQLQLRQHLQESPIDGKIFKITSNSLNDDLITGTRTDFIDGTINFKGCNFNKKHLSNR